MKKLIIFLLIMSMLMPYSAFAKATETVVPESAYAAIDAMWQEIYAAEKRGYGDAAKAQSAAAAVEASELYIDGTLRWNGEDHFTFETTTGVTCGYSARLRKLAANVKASKGANETRNGASADVSLIGPYYGMDDDFEEKYKAKAETIAEATGGAYRLYKGDEATITSLAKAIEDSKVVILDTHGETDYASGEDYTTGAKTSYILLNSAEGLRFADFEKDPRTGVYHAVDYGCNAEGVYFYAVDGTCIANHMEKDASGGLVWMATCFGMATDGLHAPLRDRGVEVVYGYSQQVTFDYDYKWSDSFFASLMAGKTVGAAAAKMKEEVGAWDWCHEFKTIEMARENRSAFPIVVSAQDPYPGQGKVDALQTVNSVWALKSGSDVELPPDCLHSELETRTTAATCSQDGVKETVCVDCGTVMTSQLLHATGHNCKGDVCTNCGAPCVAVGDVITYGITSTQTDFSDCKWSVADANLAELSNATVSRQNTGGVTEYRFSVDIKGIAEGETALVAQDTRGVSVRVTLIIGGRAHVHTWDAGVHEKEPGCASPGVDLYTCLECKQTKRVSVSALGHDYSVEVIAEPTCTEVGREKRTCKRCEEITEAEIEKLQHELFDGRCEVCGNYCVAVDETLELYTDFYDEAVYSYTWEVRDKTLASLSEPRYSDAIYNGAPAIRFHIDVKGLAEGETEVYLLSFAGEELLPRRLIVLPQEPHTHNYITEIVPATCTTDGYTAYTCACGESYTLAGEPSLGHYFVAGICIDCDAKQPNAVVVNPFKDVKESDYFYMPVQWAVDRRITNGTSETKFSPKANCTRGQIVTFLWRANGSPEPTEAKNPFKDVKTSEYYYKAVLWAVENGITTGLSETKFAPNETCTRGQIATFLWRAEGKPKAQDAKSPFKDVKSGSYYYEAVLWAVENEVTQGVGGEKFAPKESCTRAQIVTFLFRAISQEENREV